MNRPVDSKTATIAEIICENTPRSIENILVVGCGFGLEAAVLGQKLDAHVVGIDLVDDFDSAAGECAQLEVGDAMSLRFPDSSFDFVYSYHALEHFDDPLRALKEMKRVLKDGGGYWIGTPNRDRLIGYIGSENATMRQKVRWNVSDWKARLAGRFTNELGAHAGFSAGELDSLLRSVFADARNVSDTYYMRIYDTRKLLVTILRVPMLSRFLYPSVYFIGSA